MSLVVSVSQQIVLLVCSRAPERLCLTVACAVPTCLSALQVSIQQQLVLSLDLPALHYPLLLLDVSVVHQSVLSTVACAVPGGFCSAVP